MKARLLWLVAVILVLVVAVSSVSSARAAGLARAPQLLSQTQGERRSLSAPLMFVEDAGRFQVRSGQGTLWLAQDAIWISHLGPAATIAAPAGPDSVPQALPDSGRQGVNLRLSFIGANASSELQPFDPLPTTVSNFRGDDPRLWRADAPVWGGLRYAGLYPGLDLELTGPNGRLAPRLVCRAADCQATLSNVQLQIEGAQALTLGGGVGDSLRLSTAAGEIHLPLLEVIDATGRPLAPLGLRPLAIDDRVLQPYASHSPLNLLEPEAHAPNDDPGDLLYGTFLGGSDYDVGHAIAVDGEGNAYIAGETESIDFPTTPGAFDTTHNGGRDAFVVKLNPAGSDLLYAAFLGGISADFVFALAVDEAGNAYVAGWTGSSDFPSTPGAFDASVNSGSDAFVVKLNPAGNDLLYATFLGGVLSEWIYAIAVDSSGSAYVTGQTASSDFPTTPGAFDRSLNGDYDLFLAKLNPAGSDLVYSTFLGGSDFDESTAIAVDEAGSAYVTGRTTSSDFPTTPGAFDASLGGTVDAFVSKLNPSGSDLLYSSFLGGSSAERGQGIAVDQAGSAHVTGYTSSSDFPTTPGAFDTSFGPTSDAFVVKFDLDGSDLLYSTLLGGSTFVGAMPEGRDGVAGGVPPAGGTSAADAGTSIVLDEAGNALITGHTSYIDFPITPGAFDASHNGGAHDAFVTKLNAAGSGLIYSTFLGGDAEFIAGFSGSDWGNAIAIDGAGIAYVTGWTYSPYFPTTPGAFDRSLNSHSAFVVKLAPDPGSNTNFHSIYAPAVFYGSAAGQP